ncbi:dehydrogenase-like protein [Culex quinquefasciatus]|uniref:Dehydrogenase-like protein n=1 Tax=Culex quinquefasciatus TaxID=7176 RepID=B0WV71_CULQU|nr:dehydrogenase-like protein [Culex quinquefasciatus]|eukprot:XP_001861293.1 dehydrogenase-like protein [Culex quinquefasciatus]
MAFFFNFVAICTILYFLVQFILWFVLDSDIELFLRSKLGKPICKFVSKVADGRGKF